MQKVIGIIVLFIVPGLLFCQEQPKEHPQEHPSEHPTQKAATVITKDNLAAAIEMHIQSISDKNGQIQVKDELADQTLDLALVKVHKDRLSSLGDSTYFACADFVTTDGKTYDLDFFMQGQSAEELTFTEMTIHKEEGVERYSWIEKESIWKKIKIEKEK